jgi:hypothetical protein
MHKNVARLHSHGRWGYGQFGIMEMEINFHWVSQQFGRQSGQVYFESAFQYPESDKVVFFLSEKSSAFTIGFPNSSEAKAVKSLSSPLSNLPATRVCNRYSTAFDSPFIAVAIITTLGFPTILDGYTLAQRRTRTQC